eukprot:137317-Prorocentrum_minimum.AAC.3
MWCDISAQVYIAPGEDDGLLTVNAVGTGMAIQRVRELVTGLRQSVSAGKRPSHQSRYFMDNATLLLVKGKAESGGGAQVMYTPSRGEPDRIPKRCTNTLEGGVPTG